MDDLLKKYNYQVFAPENFGPWMNFDKSPELGTQGSDFPLWTMEDQAETTLHAILSENQYTIVEFGSFT